MNKEIEQLESNFIDCLKQIGVELYHDAVCRIGEYSIQLGIKATGEYASKGFKREFASDIDLFRKINDSFFGERKNEINFGSSGAFTPNDSASYWRTIHAASILKHWDSVCEIVNYHCELYTNIMSKI